MVKGEKVMMSEIVDDIDVRNGHVDPVVERYLDGWPLRLLTSEKRGRYIVASRDILKGEIVLQALPYAMVVFESQRKRICDYCYVLNESGRLEVSCKECRRSFYCSSTCRDRHTPTHSRFMCKLQSRMISWKYDHDLKSVLQLIGNIAIRRRLEMAEIDNDEVSSNRRCVSVCLALNSRTSEQKSDLVENNETPTHDGSYVDGVGYCTDSGIDVRSVRSCNIGDGGTDVHEDIDAEPSRSNSKPRANTDLPQSSYTHSDSLGTCKSTSNELINTTKQDEDLPSDSTTMPSFSHNNSPHLHSIQKCYCFDFLPPVPPEDIRRIQHLKVINDHESKLGNIRMLGLGMERSVSVSVLQTPRKGLSPTSHARKVSFHEPWGRDSHKDRESKNTSHRQNVIEGATSVAVDSKDGVDVVCGLFSAVANISLGETVGSECIKLEKPSIVDESLIRDECLGRVVLNGSKVVYSEGNNLATEKFVDDNVDAYANNDCLATIESTNDDHMGLVQSSGVEKSDIINDDCSVSDAGAQKSMYKRTDTDGAAGEGDDDSCDQKVVAIPMGVTVYPNHVDFTCLQSHNDEWDRERRKTLLKPIQQLSNALNHLFSSYMGMPTEIQSKNVQDTDSRLFPPTTSSTNTPTCTSKNVHITTSSNTTSPREENENLWQPVTSGELLSIAGRIEANCFGYRNRNMSSVHKQLGRLVVPAGAYFNHSCRPNLVAEFSKNNLASFVALDKIYEGQELCISYIDENMPRSERQFNLKESYTFDCACEKCSEPESRKGNPLWERSISNYSRKPEFKRDNKKLNKKKKGMKKGRDRQ
eukprot:CFRG3630T1